MAKTTTKPLAIGEVRSRTPVLGIKVTLQRVTSSAYVVMVGHTLLVDDLRRSFPSYDEAAGYANGICDSLKDGMTLDMLIEILSVTPAA